MALSKIESIKRNRFKISDSVTLDTGVTVPCITGQCSEVEVISQNGYRYKRGFWDKVFSDPLVKAGIQNRDFLGTIEHPEEDREYLKTPYDKASHVILKVWVDNGNPYATFGLLNNERGNQIKALIDVGHHPGVSTRGLGEYCKDDISEYISDENYLFLGYDIVTSPNFADLKLSPVTDSLRTNPLFTELVQMHHLKDSAAEDYNPRTLISEMKRTIEELKTKISIIESHI